MRKHGLISASLESVVTWNSSSRHRLTNFCQNDDCEIFSYQTNLDFNWNKRWWDCILFNRFWLQLHFLVSSLKCWKCNSQDDSCKDPFDGYSFNETLLVTCKTIEFHSLREPTRPVCIKMKLFLNAYNVTTIYRQCHWESESTSTTSCRNFKTTSAEQIEFCETCSTDGCNSSLRIRVWSNLIFIGILCKLLLN